ncbi:hypothetical protein DMUE_1243 [Dictyocoela muelleri]|nr:hypothetical protein DMUE_1243 [Dictyocoela muelleri]
MCDLDNRTIEENTREYVLEILPNRKKETFLYFFQKNIFAKSVIKTDGHRSYPYAVAGIQSTHITVNHQEGFTNKEERQTNIIECEWALFKADIGTRKEITGFAMKIYFEEYIWRSRNLRYHLSECLHEVLIKIITFLLTKKNS